MAYEYKVVPFIGYITSRESTGAVTQQLENVINEFAKQGWEFDQLGDVNIENKPGCLGMLLGAKSSYFRFDQIVFRKTV